MEKLTLLNLCVVAFLLIFGNRVLGLIHHIQTANGVVFFGCFFLTHLPVDCTVC